MLKPLEVDAAERRTFRESHEQFGRLRMFLIRGQHSLSGRGNALEATMLQWLRSFARRSRRNSILEPAVAGVMEGMERRLFLDACNISGTTMNYVATGIDDDIIVSVNGSDVTVSNRATNPQTDCTLTGATAITINGGAGNDTINASGSTSIGVTVLGGDGNDFITGSANVDSLKGENGNDSVI